MDPYSSIVTALALGAAAGISSSAEQAIKDCYFSIKALVNRKFPHVDLAPLELDPKSKSRRQMIMEELARANAFNDRELLEEVGKLLQVLLNYSNINQEVVGIKIEEVEALSLKIKDVLSSGSGILIAKSKFSGDITLQGIKAGQKNRRSGHSKHGH